MNKKRILSFFLALALIVSLVPTYVFATEGEPTDPTVTEPVVTEPVVTEPVVTEPVVTEPAAPVGVECEVCGALDCQSTHENWCEICKVDDCGQTHEPTAPSTEATEPTQPSTEPTQPSTQPSTEATEPSTEPTQPTEPAEPEGPQVGDKIWIKSGSRVYKNHNNVDKNYYTLMGSYEVEIKKILTNDEGAAEWYEFRFTDLGIGEFALSVGGFKYVHVENTTTVKPDEQPEDEHACSCGENAPENLANHADSCPRKQYIKTLFEGKTAEEIYAQWETYDVATRNDILAMLEVYDRAKFEELKGLVGSVVDGTATTVVDGVEITVSGNIPESAELKVEKSNDSVQTVVNEMNNPYSTPSSDVTKRVYLNETFDINILNDGVQWQPDEPITVTLSFENNIPSSAYVEVMHLLDHVDAVKKESEDGEYNSFTQSGLSTRYPNETSAAEAAGCGKDTIVYQILASSMGDVVVSDNNVTFTLSSFSNVNITASNVESAVDVETYSTSSENALELNKFVSDGTGEGDFDITLEAYATGEEVPAPVDVVFVLDQSTSMFTIVDSIKSDDSNGYDLNEIVNYAKNNPDQAGQEGYFIMRVNDNATYFNGGNKQTYSTWYRYAEDYDKGTHTNDRFHVIGQSKSGFGAVSARYTKANYEDGQDDWIWFAARWNASTQQIEYNVTTLACNTSKTDQTVSGKEYYSDDRYWLPLPTCASSINTTNLRFYKSIYGATYDAMKVFYTATANIPNLQVALVGFSEGGGIYNATVKNDYVEDLDLGKTGKLTTATVNDLTSYIHANISTNYGQNAFAKAGSADLLDRIKNYNPNYYGTVTDAGFALANYLFKNPSITGAREDAVKFVILYTDGNPMGSLTRAYDANTTSYSNDAIAQSYITKNTHNGTVYAITPPSAVNKSYLSYISSEYKSAQSMSNHGTKNSDGNDYAIAATSTTELTQAFQNLAKTISQTAIQLGGTTILKDVISDYFVLPESLVNQIEGKTEEQSQEIVEKYIKVFTADYDGMSFGANTAFDADIVLSKDSSGKYRTINVSNFSYKDNYISSIPRNGNFYGRKLVVQVPIDVNPDFLGGDNVVTNKNTAGIYADGEGVQYFPVPNVDIDVKDITPIGTEQNIYVSQQVNLPNAINLGEFQVGTTTYRVDGINNAYVDIVYTLKDAEGKTVTYTIPAGTPYASLTGQGWDETGGLGTHPILESDKDYTVTCQLFSKLNTDDDPNNDTTNNSDPKLDDIGVDVYKPVITFKDSAIDLGDTADYATENLVKVEWKHGNDLAPDSMGTAPTLEFTYDPPADDFKKETDVKVTEVKALQDATIHVPVDMIITDHAIFYREMCSAGKEGAIFPGCDHTAPILVSSGGINFTVHLNNFDIVITKDVTGNYIDPNQSFVFNVTGPNGFDMNVMVVGEGSVTIKGVPAGVYTVKELTEWSWRYICTDDEQTVSAEDAVNGIGYVTFENTRDKEFWLSGDCVAENWFHKK